MLRNFGDFYYPTLIIRPDEMRGLNELPSNEKDLIFPIFQLCPWVGSASFDKTFDKIFDVYGQRPCIVDLDKSFYNWNPDGESTALLHSMIQGHDGANDWIELVTKNENYIPCVQHENYTESEIQRQIDAFVELGRGLVFKIRAKHFELNARIIDFIQQVYDLMGPTYILVIIDLELIEQLDFSENQARVILEQISQLERLRIVLSAASFPSDFSFVDGIESVGIQSRQLFAKIRARFNEIELSYSDWGSTKPRKPGFGAPLKRIDYPMSDQWILARSKTHSWDYMEAAGNLVVSTYWQNPPNIWGVQMIELAARNDAYAINTRPKSSAARINIHLFVQAHYGHDAGGISTDEPWTD